MAEFQRIGTDTGALVERKNAAYGNSFATCGAALKLLYPEGLRPEQMADALLLVRIWDKMMRIATARTAMGENPYQDIAGYGILGVAMHTTGSHTPGAEQEACGSVSEQDAGNQSTEQNASAAVPAATPTMPTASGLNGSLSQLPSRLRSAQSSPSEAAPAPTATAHAPNVAAAHERSLIIKTFLEAVEAEVDRAIRLHGVEFASLHEAYAVILEELDELWTLTLKKQHARKSCDIWEELVQIAATSVKASLSMKNYVGGGGA